MSMRERLFGRRGFIGPLGDDFPAIFPIAMGLMFFFGAISLTYLNYTDKRDTATLMRANLAMSKGVRAQITFDADYWKDVACPLFERAKANYGVRAKMRLVQITETAGVVDVGDFDACGDAEDPPPGRRAVAMNYPVVIRLDPGFGQPKITRAFSLVITTWR
jgi:hypothetical protein